MSARGIPMPPASPEDSQPFEKALEFQSTPGAGNYRFARVPEASKLSLILSGIPPPRPNHPGGASDDNTTRVADNPAWRDYWQHHDGQNLPACSADPSTSLNPKELFPDNHKPLLLNHAMDNMDYGRAHRYESNMPGLPVSGPFTDTKKVNRSNESSKSSTNARTPAFQKPKLWHKMAVAAKKTRRRLREMKAKQNTRKASPRRWPLVYKPQVPAPTDHLAGFLQMYDRDLPKAESNQTEAQTPKKPNAEARGIFDSMYEVSGAKNHRTATPYPNHQSRTASSDAASTTSSDAASETDEYTSWFDGDSSY